MSKIELPLPKLYTKGRFIGSGIAAIIASLITIVVLIFVAIPIPLVGRLPLMSAFGIFLVGVVFGIVYFFQASHAAKAKADGYLNHASKWDFIHAKIHAAFWSAGMILVFLGLSGISGISATEETKDAGIALFVIGWLLCGGSAIIRVLKSFDHKEAKAKHRARMQGTDMGVRLFSSIWFWLAELGLPILFAPIMNIVRIFKSCIRGRTNAYAYTVAGDIKEEQEIASAVFDDPRGLGDRISDAILDMTSDETTGVKRTIKIETDEYGQTVCRDGLGNTINPTKIDDDTVEYDGKRYKIDK